MTWPAGQGLNFKGVYDLYTDEFALFGGNERIGGNALAAHLPEDIKDKLDEDVELARGGLSRFDPAAYREGHLSPVFFGSALKNFGVRDLLDRAGRKRAQPAPAGRQGPRGQTLRSAKSPASSSRSRPTWTPIIATAWRSCAWLRAASAAT